MENANKYHNNLPFGKPQSPERKAYNLEGCRLKKLFFEDMANEYGYADNPKRARLESIAWDHGHSSGYEAVSYWLEELVELV